MRFSQKMPLNFYYTIVRKSKIMSKTHIKGSCLKLPRTCHVSLSLVKLDFQRNKNSARLSKGRTWSEAILGILFVGPQILYVWKLFEKCEHCLLFCAWPVIPLGVVSKVRTSRTNERTFIWYFTPSPPPPPPVLKRKCDRQCEKMYCRRLWMLIVHILHYTLPKQCRLSHAGMLPRRFSIHCKMNRKTISNSWTTIFFLPRIQFSLARRERKPTNILLLFFPSRTNWKISVIRRGVDARLKFLTSFHRYRRAFTPQERTLVRLASTPRFTT